MRKLIWLGILTPLAVLCFMNSACGGWVGWPGKSTNGDAKVTEEVYVTGGSALENGLWTYYVSYNNVGGQAMKTVSTFRDSTAPPVVFTSDGLLEQHFNDHVGVLVTQAYDRDGDGVICWQGCFSNDYSLVDAFCPAFGLNADPDSSDGFSAYCNRGLWSVLVATSFFAETKSNVPG